MTYTLVRRGRTPLLDLHTRAGGGGFPRVLGGGGVALGLLVPARDRADTLWLAPAELATAARIQRLRAGFSLNYAAVGLVLDLLDRIEELEAALRRAPWHPARTTAQDPTERIIIGG